MSRRNSREGKARRRAERDRPAVHVHTVDDMTALAASGGRLPCGCDPGTLLLSMNDPQPDGLCEWPGGCGEEWELTAYRHDGGTARVCLRHGDELMRGDPDGKTFTRFSGRWHW